MNTFDTRHYCLINKIASASLTITWEGKKIPEKIKWGDITKENFSKYHQNSKNGFAILAGMNNIVVLDCDIGKAEGTFPQDILDTLDACCKSIVKTPNGKHYYFTGTAKQANGGYWKGERVQQFDILSENKLIFAPPSHYSKGDEIKRYEWAVGNLSTLIDLPDEIQEYLKAPIKEYSSTKTFQQTSTETIIKLLNGLSVERLQNYDDWLKIGIALYNEGGSCELWDEASKKARNYQLGACSEKWRSFKGERNTKITLGTLFMFLKQDNPTLFEELSKERTTLYSLCPHATHASTAELFYTLSPNKYIYSPQMGWYELQPNNIYKYSEKEPENWKLTLLQFLRPVLYEAAAYYLSLSKDAEDTERDVFTSYGKGCYKHLQSIENTGYLNSVLSWLQEYCCDSNIYNKIDKNRDLLAFQDCVYDFTLCKYRPILPTDYISLTTGYNAPPLTTPVCATLEKFLYSLFEHKEKELYLLVMGAYCLWGDCRFQEFFLLQGDAGGNGKSLFMMVLMKSVLGEYFSTLPSEYLTDPISKKGAPLPELAQCVNSRVVAISEPDSTTPIREDFIKGITGGDEMKVRKLHKDSFTFLPQFTIVILCNLMKFNKPSSALRRRLAFLKFPFEFRTEQEHNPQNELSRLADPSIEKSLKTEEVRDSFMALLLRTFQSEIKDKNELKKPILVKKETDDYFNSQVPIASWFFEKYTMNGNTQKDRITATELVEAYQADTGKQIEAKTMGMYLMALKVPSMVSKGRTKYIGVLRKPNLE